MIRSLYIFRASVIALLATLAVCLSGVALADWAPKKPVDFIIMAGKGGGADKMARLMQSVIEQHGFSSKPFGHLEQFLHYPASSARPRC